ncbi:MAG: GTP-binding protein [Halioglobus sp.]|nr:GTP-binding protein [Halioglobus sp.]MDG2327494.1 GTP-binding protein [Halioglobus sp.]
MSVKSAPILSVPTNIITGFLGAGKTSAILNLLKHKPEGERWAILVNEFGEIGVDGSLVEGHAGIDTDIHIREVPGGCMCCAAGLPMQLALNQLLRRARPHRLLIEPTGLGHPFEVLQTLSANHNREVLSIEKTLTLVDARNLQDERYTSHETFRQQLSIADVVVANKVDLYGPDDRSALESYIRELCHPNMEMIYTEYGELDLEHLAGPTVICVEPADAGHTDKSPPLLAQDLPFPACGFITAVNEGEGFESIGWRFSPQKVFDRGRLLSFLRGLDVERMKAIFITATGVFAYNLTRDALTETELDDCSESRIEIITDTINIDWVNNLTSCMVDY